MMKKYKWMFIIIGLLAIVYFAVTQIVPSRYDKKLNKTIDLPPYQVSEKAMTLYNSLDFIADLHCDALLWSRDLNEKNTLGHFDFPRMQEANMALQAFTIVTKSPAGQNFSKNSGDAFDNITLLSFLQGRPVSSWFSLYERAEFQSRKLHKEARDYEHEFVIVKNKEDLNHLINARKSDKQVMGGYLGIEGGHCLESKIQNLDRIYDEGVRMLGPTHFFDNELGGSAHGIKKEGLSDFGRQVIKRMNELGMIIDVAHASPTMIDDILDQSTQPIVVSHTGVRGTKDNIRNLSDEHIIRIAENGGLIGVGFFEGAVNTPLTQGVVEAMKHIKAIAGVECITLGSDYDGAATVPFDVTGLPLLVEEMIKQGFREHEIRAIMGENVKRYLMKQLP